MNIMQIKKMKPLQQAYALGFAALFVLLPVSVSLARAEFSMPVEPMSTTLTTSEQQFLEIVSKRGAYELQASIIASERAADGRLRALATMLVSERSESNLRLKMLANYKVLDLSTAISEEQAKMLDKLRTAASGAAFDRCYVQQMEITQQKSLVLFASASSQSEDLDLRDYIRTNVPDLQNRMQVLHNLSSDI